MFFVGFWLHLSRKSYILEILRSLNSTFMRLNVFSLSQYAFWYDFMNRSAYSVLHLEQILGSIMQLNFVSSNILPKFQFKISPCFRKTSCTEASHAKTEARVSGTCSDSVLRLILSLFAFPDTFLFSLAKTHFLEIFALNLSALNDCTHPVKDIENVYVGRTGGTNCAVKKLLCSDQML